MKVILLAGGPSKGLRYVTGRDGSRSLVRLLGRTLLDKHMEGLLKFTDEVYVVSDDSLVEQHCRRYGAACRFVAQTVPGIEGAICSGLSAARAEGLVTILYGDTFYEDGFLATHMSKLISSYEPLITVTRPILLRGRYLRLDVDPIDGHVVATGKGAYVFAGLISLPAASAVENICRHGMSIHRFIDMLASKRLMANIWLGTWLDLDTAWDYLVAVQLELQRMKETRIAPDARLGSGVVLEGPVYIDQGARVDHYAVIKGPAYVGPRSLVGAHSFVRGSAVLDNAVIGAYAEVKRSVVYEAARVGSHSYIADSILGRGALASPYTVTLNTPYTGVSGEIVIMTTQPLERLKIGAIIAAGASTKPHTVTQPAVLYTGE